MGASRRFSRRSFCVLTAVIGGEALLAACGTRVERGGQGAAATTAPEKSGATGAAATSAPAAATTPSTTSATAGTPAAQPKAAARGEAKFIAAKWVIDEWRLPDWVEQYNKQGLGKVSMEQVPEGWDQKVMAMVRSGDVAWDGVGIITPFIEKVKFAESGMIQPIDQYINVSTVDGAKELLQDMVPTVKQDVSYKGKVYGVPYSVEAIGLMWYREPLSAVGFKDVPATWDETMDAARKVGEQMRSQQITPIAWNPGLHTSLQGLMHTTTKTPYTPDGLLDITSEVGVKTAQFLLDLVKAGVTPPHGSDGYLELWQRKKLSMLLAQNSRGVWAQRVHGPDQADTGKLPLPAKGAPHAGSPFWSNTFAAFEKAKNPQAYVDFLIWLLGPKNKEVHTAIIESGKAPVLNSIYKSQIETSDRWRWMVTFRDMIADSVPYPENTFWAIQNQKIMPWITKLTDKDATLTPAEAMKNAFQEVKDEVAKQKVQ